VPAYCGLLILLYTSGRDNERLENGLSYCRVSTFETRFLTTSAHVANRYKIVSLSKQCAIEPNIRVTYNAEVLAVPAIILVKRTVEFEIGSRLRVLPLR
jgi:hypothetical protein